MNLLSYILRYIHSSSIGNIIDGPLRVVGLLVGILLLSLSISFGVGISSYFIGYQQMASVIVLPYFTFLEYLPYLFSLRGVVVVVILASAAYYTWLRYFTACDNCGPFMLEFSTIMHHDRKEWEILGEELTQQESICKCRDCGRMAE